MLLLSPGVQIYWQSMLCNHKFPPKHPHYRAQLESKKGNHLKANKNFIKKKQSTNVRKPNSMISDTDLTSLGRHKRDGSGQTVLPLLHQRQSSFDDIKTPHEIHIYHKLDLIQSLLLKLLRHKNPLVNYQDIDRSGIVSRLLDSVVVTNISRKYRNVEAGGTANRFFGFLEFVKRSS